MSLFAYSALVGRILLLGTERILVKKLGTKVDSVAATFLFFFIGALFLLPFSLTSLSQLSHLHYIAASSLFYTAAFVLYVKSLSEGEASLVTPLYNASIFFILVLAVLFLGEKFTLLKLGGIVLLVYGASFLKKGQSVVHSLQALLTDSACRNMIFASLLMAVGRLIDRAAFSSTPAPSALAYAFAVYSLMSVLMFLILIYRKGIEGMVELVKQRPGLSIASGFTNAFTYLFLLYALTSIEVSVAEPLSMLGVLVTLFLSSMFLGEKIRERLLGAVVMIVGAALLIVN